MNKKVISSVLAGTMALSTMGVVASADAVVDNTTDTGTNAYTAKAGLLEAIVDADIPADLETYINPYGAQVIAQDKANVEEAVAFSDGIISPTYKIVNNSDTAGLKVNATAKITPSSTVAVNTKVLDDAKLQKATEKQVFAFLNTTTDVIASKPVFASTSYLNNDYQLAFTEDGAKAANIMSLTKDGADDPVTTGYFYVGGQCTPNPETEWNTKDTVTLDLILDLVPSAGDKADLTVESVMIAGKKYADFLPGTYSYNLAAAGSKTKAANITVKAKDEDAKVYIKFNGKMYADAATKDIDPTDKDDTSTVGTLKCEAGDQTATVSGVVTKAFDKGEKPTDEADDVPGELGDYKAGDKLEFIVYNPDTFESITYTFNFTE